MISQDDYLAFLRNTVGIPVAALPDDSIYITASYEIGVALTPCGFAGASSSIYALMVYSCGASFLINNTPDQQGQTFFSDLRDKFGLLQSFNGIITSAADEGTSAAAVVPEFQKRATLQELQWMKDPFGRQFLGFLQMAGSNWVLV